MGKFTKVLNRLGNIYIVLMLLLGFTGLVWGMFNSCNSARQVVYNKIWQIKNELISVGIANTMGENIKEHFYTNEVIKPLVTKGNIEKTEPNGGELNSNKNKKNNSPQPENYEVNGQYSDSAVNAFFTRESEKQNSKVVQTSEISLLASQEQTFSSDFFIIRRLIFNNRLQAGKIYKINVSKYNFNEWIIKWNQSRIPFTKKGNIASISNLTPEEESLNPFEIYILPDEKKDSLARLDKVSEFKDKPFVPIDIHADIVTARAKNMGAYALGTIGGDKNNASVDALSVQQTLTSSKPLELISQIIYTTGDSIYIKPNQDFVLSSIELWRVADTSEKSKAALSATSIVTAKDNSNSSIAVINDKLTANVTSYETTYNLDSTSGLKFSTLNIIPRIVWGANPSTWDPIKKTLDINNVKRLKYVPEYKCRWLPEYYRPTRFVIHHTVTHNYPSDPLREIREIYLYHAYSRGWGDIGYNYIIDSSGRIFEGKIGGDGVKGYHAFEAANDMTIGIALIGNFTYSNPTSAQLEALKKLLAEKAALYNIPLVYTGTASLSDWLDKYITVFGHRHLWVWDWDTNSWYYRPTACPGEKFVTSGTLKATVQAAADYLQDHFADIKSARSWALQMLEDYDDADNIYAQVYFENSGTREDLIQKTPRYSGIKNLYVASDGKLHLTIGVIDNYDCGWVVPPKGWKGYDVCGSKGCMYFPTYNGPYDRAVILFTLFKLSPLYKDIKIVDGNVGWIESR